MKMTDTLQELPNVTQRYKVNKCCWENGADRLASCRVAINFDLCFKKRLDL